MLKRSIENRKVESFKNQHTWVSLDKISPQLAKAVVLTEDQKFYQHHGFDWEEIRKMRDDHLNKGTKHHIAANRQERIHIRLPHRRQEDMGSLLDSSDRTTLEQGPHNGSLP